MVESQGFTIDAGRKLIPSKQRMMQMEIPSELIPYCPHCRRPMSMNLRTDNTFVEDEGWHRAAGRYRAFLQNHQDKKVLFLELAVGSNTPGIVKFPFWRMTAANPKAVYACVNLGEAYAPGEIADRSICMNEDIGEVLKKLK